MRQRWRSGVPPTEANAGIVEDSMRQSVDRTTRGRPPLLSVVVPFYNESASVSSLLDALYPVLEKTACRFEVVAIDDGSSDETWQQLKVALPHRRGLKLIRLSRNFGKEAAVSAGLEKASGDAIIVLDGDLQHPPELINQMVPLWSQRGFEIVEAVKEARGTESVLYRLGAGLFYKLFRILTGYDLEPSSDFKLMDRKVVDAWRRMEESNLFFRGMIAWLGFRRTQIGFAVQNRAAGVGKFTLPRLLRFAVTAMTAFSTSALHIITILGFAFFALAIVIGARTLYLYFLGTAVTGFTTVILLQLLIGAALMVSLGILGEYLARIYTEVKRRPRYIMSEVIACDDMQSTTGNADRS
jgi:glycosyltransferase involved in cell wall biosynthesis